MCNEILGNYSKKEDQSMIAAFGTRPKRRLNRVFDALGFEYPDYERLDKDAEGQKRKRVASALNKDDEDQLKKKKLKPEPKTDASKKRKATSPKQKAIDEEEETAATPSATDVEEILKVMTESLPVKLSPLGPHLTKLFQRKKEPAKTKKAARPKKQRIITVTEVIEGTPPQASASKTPVVENITATEAAPSEAVAVEAATAEDIHLESTIADIDKILLNMAAEEAAAAIEGTTAPEPKKEKEIAEDTSEDEVFNFQNLVGQELTKAEKEELKEYVISCGYRPGALLFGGIDDERLGCIWDQTGAKVIGTLSKSIGFPKLETDISRYRRQHIVDSLFYSNFKVNNFFLTFIVFNNEVFLTKVVYMQSMLLSKALKMQQDLEDKKHKVIIENLESKVKEQSTAIEKKDFELQTTKGLLAEAEAKIAELNTKLLCQSEHFEQEKQELNAKFEAEVQKNSDLKKSLTRLQNKCLEFSNRCVQRLK
jgi:hypothetical protein